jgi:hypothetical protein
MYHRSFKAILVGLIILGLLAVVGVSILGALMGRARHPSDEWWQGYTMGRLESGEGEGSVLPYTLSGRRHATLGPLACGLGLLILGVPLLLLCVGGLFFKRQAWKAAGGPHGPSKAWHWHRHRGPWAESGREPSEEEIARMKAWYKAHGPIPPWCGEWEEPAEDQPDEPAKDEPR